LAGVAKNKDTVAGSGDDGSIFGLRQREYVAPVEAGAQLLPVGAAVNGTKDTAEGFVVDDTRVDALGMFAIDEQGRR